MNKSKLVRVLGLTFSENIRKLDRSETGLEEEDELRFVVVFFVEVDGEESGGVGRRSLDTEHVMKTPEDALHQLIVHLLAVPSHEILVAEDAARAGFRLPSGEAPGGEVGGSSEGGLAAGTAGLAAPATPGPVKTDLSVQSGLSVQTYLSVYGAVGSCRQRPNNRN